MDNDQTNPNNEVMNGDEAATFLKMPKSTLLKLCSEGQLPAVKVGRNWRFNRTALEKWKSEKAGSEVDFSDDSGVVGEPTPLDFEENLSEAEASVGKQIKEVVGSVGGDDFETTGDVVELDSMSEGVGEVHEIEEAPAPKSSRRARSSSALDLMAQISDKSPGRRGAKTTRAKTAPAPAPRTKPAPASAPVSPLPKRDTRLDDGAVEVSRPYNRHAGAAPAPRAPERRSSGGGAFGVLKKVVYWAVVLVVLAMAGVGVKSMLVPISTEPMVGISEEVVTTETPALPEFQVVYRHNEEESLKEDNLAVPTPPPSAPEPAAPTAPLTSTAAVDTVALQAPPAPQQAPQAAAAAKEGTQQPAVPIATNPPVSRSLEAINRLLPALFNLSGTTVNSNNNEIRITFQEGVFSSGITVSESGKSQLSRVAEFLKVNAPDFWVIIEGQTDSKPVRSNSPFRDNYTLGLRRAVAATEVMRSETQFPNDRLLASSSGGLPPPFPENDPGSASRNRTVILRLVPRILE
ncbi:MAG: helix-turn-helix domain-containing protein [Terrimicrobiaceae bacterium]